MASSSHQPSSKLQHGGNTYSQLTTKQQSLVRAQLPLQCHSLETLNRSGILLDTDPFPQDISSKKPEGLNMTDFLPTPSRNPSIQRRKAIVMTCQAVKSPDGGTQPISICVIDFFTGQTLMDSFIAPSAEVSDWKTEVHGISARTIKKAFKGNNCLRGWREARTRLFEYVSAQTVFVGWAMETKAQDNEAKREASLQAMVQEEERNLLTHENGKQGARRDWETRNRAERRAKWVESQRDD